MNFSRPSIAFLVGYLILGFGGVAHSLELFDDFEDGDLLDGIPVVWDPTCLGGPDWEIIDGDLYIGASHDANVNLLLDEIIEGDVSLRTEFRFDGPGSVRLGLHGICNPLNVYFGGVESTGEIKFNKWVNGSWTGNLAQAQVVPYPEPAAFTTTKVH